MRVKKDFCTPHLTPLPQGERTSFQGRAVSGTGRGTFFTQLKWVKEQCEQKLGFVPYPGTLNLEVEDRVLPLLQRACRDRGDDLVPPDCTFCVGKVLKVKAGEIPAAVVFPEERVRVHGASVIEIIAPVDLRTELGISDGDSVEITLDTVETS